ncbi:type II toxin-antitoxin system antitoxin DNA ADP-ribosyl glycohydrolase DarG [Actinosynnema sp. NPDC004786]
MIIEQQGDLLAADVDALVNTVNCVGVMGKGLALQFKNRYPENFDAYARACKKGEVQLGRMYVVELPSLVGPRYIVNFPTKGHWKAKSRLTDIKDGLADLADVIARLGIKSIAIPALGSGNGGLDWQEVEPAIFSFATDLTGVEVHLYPPSKEHRSLAPKPLRMTWGRAALVQLIENYARARQSVEPWESFTGASHLEIQKLTYFAQLFLPQFNLKFEQGRYGPYSERTRHLVQEMEGTFLRGFGDGTSAVLDLTPVEPTELGVNAAASYVAEAAPDRDIPGQIIEPVMETIKGYEGPYTLELLASTHWASVNGASNPECAWEFIQQWTPRKRRLFTRKHVENAWSKLESVELIKVTAV